MKIYRAANTCFQMYSYASLFEPSIFRYKSIERIEMKRTLGLQGWTDDHHIFPKCLRNHPALYDIDIDHCKNLKIMPNRRTKMPSHILCHTNHPSYNKFVKKQLDQLPIYTQDERKYQLYLLLYYLEYNLNFTDKIPFS
jgi:hypothetical protein